MKLQVKSEHYKFSEYVDTNRWMSYYYQLRLIEEYHPQSVLEIGPGNKILGKIIQTELKYFSTDIDKKLQPDVVSSIKSLPFKSNYFDAIMVFQVLEHFPFNTIPDLLDSLLNISGKYLFISLPFANHKFMIEFFTPVINRINLQLLIPRFYKKHKFDGQHYWEVGTKGYGRKFIRNQFNKQAKLINEFVPKENTNHIFYVLEKR